MHQRCASCLTPIEHTTMVDFRINWTLQFGEVRKSRLPGSEKSALWPPVGAVSNRTASAQLETVPTKHGERKCLFIFWIHYKSTIEQQLFDEFTNNENSHSLPSNMIILIQFVSLVDNRMYCKNEQKSSWKSLFSMEVQGPYSRGKWTVVTLLQANLLLHGYQLWWAHQSDRHSPSGV